MPTADLPAHNIRESFAGPTGVTIVGGPEALADHDTSTYVRIEGTGAEGINVGYDGLTDVLGFGVWEQPAGTTVTSIQFVAEGYRDSGLAHGAVTDWDAVIGNSNSDQPVVNYPVVLVEYEGSPYPAFGGYNLSTLPLDVVGESIAPGQINLSSFVLAPGPSSGPRAGGLGLAPAVQIAEYPFPVETQAVVLTYLAIRITYEAATVVRQYPRDDGRGLEIGPARLWPPSQSRRLAGGYPGGSGA